LGKAARRLLVACCALVFAQSSAKAEPVRAEAYRAFWLWAGVQPQPVLNHADEVYILAGEVIGENPPRIISQRSATPKIERARVWIVYRAQTMVWDKGVMREIIRQMQVWKANGNSLLGLQIDFDAGTKNLDNYAEFLKSVRGTLPSEYALSITGLLDWSANGDPAGLDALTGIVDEVVLQIYQGRKVIPGYARYLQNLDQLKVPFRIGLLQGGDWTEPDHLKANPQFHGYVVFLLNHKSTVCSVASCP
jgi:Protein of unknown function (DUF3142)